MKRQPFINLDNELGLAVSEVRNRRNFKIVSDTKQVDVSLALPSSPPIANKLFRLSRHLAVD